MNSVVDFINVNRDRYIDELKEYLSIPSISALPDYATDVIRCAEWTAGELKRIGLDNVRLVETPGYPVVCAEWLRRRLFSMGITMYSPLIRSISGIHRHLKRRSGPESYTLVAQRMIKAKSLCTSRLLKPT